MHLTVTSVDYRPHGIAAVTVAEEATGGGDVMPGDSPGLDSPGLDSPTFDEGDESTVDAATLILADTAMLHRLTRGRTLTSAEWDAIREEGRTGLGVRHAMNLVARKPRSESEVRRALLAHAAAFETAEVEAALARLRAIGAIDDLRWASTYVSQPRARARGAMLLRRELSQRGVPASEAAEALDGRDEDAAALAAALKRATGLRSLEPEAARRRLYDFLRRRGFADPVARRAMSTALAEVFAEASTEG